MSIKLRPTFVVGKDVNVRIASIKNSNGTIHSIILCTNRLHCVVFASSGLFRYRYFLSLKLLLNISGNHATGTYRMFYPSDVAKVPIRQVESTSFQTVEKGL